MASRGGAYDIAKAGWMYRQSSVLRRWKRNWFVLDRQGDLRYFESQDQPRAEERYVIRAVVTAIKTGPDCRKADPPEGVSSAKATFLELCMRDGDNMLLCADSFDDMRAWQIALEEARTFNAPHGVPGRVHGIPMSTTVLANPYGPVYGTTYYGGLGGIGSTYHYPGQVISAGPATATAQVVHANSGATTVIQRPQQIVYMQDDPYCSHRRHHRHGCHGYYGGGHTTYYW